MNYKYEYERYKDKVERQDREIAGLKRDLEGWKELAKTWDAVEAAILHTVGADQEHKLQLDSKLVGEAMREAFSARAEVELGEAGEPVYQLYWVPGEDEKTEQE